MKREVSPLKKHIEESPKLRALRQKRFVRRRRLVVLLSILCAVCVGGFVYAMHLPRFTLSTIVVSGNKVVDTDSITAKTETYLAGNYAYIIPHRVSFFYPKQKIISVILATFPRIKAVSVYRQNLTTLFISVSETRGRALWCGPANDPIDMTTQCYFTDEAARIVSLAPQYSGNVYPRFFGGTIDTATSPLGKTFLDDATFQNLLAFQHRITVLGFHVKAITIGTNDEDDLVLDTGQGNTALVRFAPEANYQTLADNLTAALTKDTFNQALAKDKANLEYFDLRFPDKVYYKFTDGQ